MEMATNLTKHPLSERELEVFRNIKEGLSSKQIASKLKISESTVKNHRRLLMIKLNVKNAAELCAKHLYFT